MNAAEAAMAGIFGSKGSGGGGANFTFSVDGKFQYPEEVVVPNTVTSLQSTSLLGFNGHTEHFKVSFEPNSVITSIPQQAFRYSGITELVLPESITSIGSYAWSGCSKLKKLVLNSICTIANQSSSVANPFSGCTVLEDIQIPQNWTNDLYISSGLGFTNVLTHDSMVAMIANLYDYTGDTAHSLTLGATNLARLSEEEKAIATAKNWTLA